MKFNNPHRSARTQRQFRSAATRPLKLLAQCPVYQATPLTENHQIADQINVDKVYIKDESRRMRLGSFKALGGAFAVAQMISDAAKSSDFASEVIKSTAARMTFATASAGNHGLSVAAGARIFGARAVIFLSSTVPEGFADRIRALDAQVVRVEGSYEDSVAEAIRQASSNGWFLLADGSWEGYTERPALVMEGYTVLAEECRTEFAQTGSWPTHVFLQAGVGGLAAAVAAHIRDYWEQQPTIIVVEPDAAPCLMESAKHQSLTHITGPLSNMGRLDCKDASLIAFNSLIKDADLFVTLTDGEALAATEYLSGLGIKTTPSGGAPVATLQGMDLAPHSRCLVLITEGVEGG